MNPMVIVAAAVVSVVITGAVMYWIAAKHDEHQS
ncbi:hypothetical protein AU15_11185 [Marinobacter salarius]|uniref:Uncharacterized protein n=1 Tax=Marinobacter salarius TaxID=1420917 RepID=W5YWD1_9GAMM|nr:hypothetical protein AU15_11185 [Marinobacter salarius]